jgi:hypothetical protein
MPLSTCGETFHVLGCDHPTPLDDTVTYVHPDDPAYEAWKALNLARWCFQHDTLVFFCEHRHNEEF